MIIIFISVRFNEFGLFRLARAVKHYKAITSTMGLRVGEGKGGGRRRQRRGPSAAAATSAANLEKLFTIDGCTVEDLCLTFVAPSMGSKQGPVELVPGGIDVAVTVQNLESYLQKVYRYILSSSVRVQIDAMKAGFQEVCSTEAFSVLDLRERSQLISGEDGKGIRSWDFSTESLRNNIVCAQGYTLGSPSIQNLIEILGEMNPATRRGFIQYLTGCPRLPAGQLAALRPKITVVRVAWSKSNPSVLPLASTCTNSLKLPDYPTKELMRERIYYALRECPYGFQLS
eukprot:jgi/Bigna1/136079/aug1.32_g10787